MHTSRILMLLGAVIGAVSLPLPHLESDLVGRVNGIEGDSWPAVVALAVIGVLALIGDRAEGFGRPRALAAVSVGGVAVVFTAFKLGDASRAVDVAGGSIGLGLWVLAVGALASLAGAVFSLSRKLG